MTDQKKAPEFVQPNTRANEMNHCKDMNKFLKSGVLNIFYNCIAFFLTPTL